jgi:hypothetical protein
VAETGYGVGPSSVVAAAVPNVVGGVIEDRSQVVWLTPRV